MNHPDESLVDRFSKPRPLWAKILIFLGVILFIIAVPYGIAEGYYQVRVNRLNNEVDKAFSKALEGVDTPSAGVEEWGYNNAPFWINSICIDNGPCPSITRGRLILINKGERSNFIVDAEQKIWQASTEPTVYSNGDTIGEKVDGNIFVALGVSDLTSDKKAPYPAPQGKEWAIFGVNAYER